MNRRAFLAAAAAVAVGCKKTSTSTPVPAVDAMRIGRDREERERHLSELERFRVPSDAVRTTPPPPDDVLAVAPELKGLTKVAVRLHPRYSDEPAPDQPLELTVAPAKPFTSLGDDRDKPSNDRD